MQRLVPITNEAEMVNGKIKRIGEKLYSDISVFKHSLEESEYFQQTKIITSSVADASTSSPYYLDSLTCPSNKCALVYGVRFNKSDSSTSIKSFSLLQCCCLYVLLRYGEGM